MSYTRMIAATITGTGYDLVTVEAAGGPPGAPLAVRCLGLSESAFHAAQTRVRAAMANSDLRFPIGDVTFDIAAMRRSGLDTDRAMPLRPSPPGALDLALAAAVLAVSGQLDAERCAGVVLLAELGLDGSLRPVPGIRALLGYARKMGYAKAVVAPADADMAARVTGLEVHAPHDLASFAASFASQPAAGPASPESPAVLGGGSEPTDSPAPSTPATPGVHVPAEQRRCDLPYGFDYLTGFIGSQVAFGFDLGSIILSFFPEPSPVWVSHAEGPAAGACWALLDDAGIADPADDEEATAKAWDRIGIDLAPYGSGESTGWVLSAATYATDPDQTLELPCLEVPADAADRLAAALRVLGLADRFRELRPAWFLCGRSDHA